MTITFEAKAEAVATYEDFVVLYEGTLKNLLSYNLNQAGSKVFAEKLGLLADMYPEFEDRYDSEN